MKSDKFRPCWWTCRLIDQILKPVNNCKIFVIYTKSNNYKINILDNDVNSCFLNQGLICIILSKNHLFFSKKLCSKFSILDSKFILKRIKKGENH